MLNTITSSAVKARLLVQRQALLGICLLIMQGCGGGSSPTLLQGNPAFRATCVGGYQALGAGTAYPYNALMIASPTGSAIHSKAALLLISAMKQATRVKASPSRGGGTLTYDPSLNLYSADVSFHGNVATLSFFTDSAGTQPAGAVTITLPTNLTNLTDPTSFASYPVVITIAVDITSGNLPCSGKVVVTFSDNTGANSMTGTMTLTKDNVVIDLNLALSDQLNVSGTITVHASGATIQMTNVAGNVLDPLTANLSVSPYGWTGTGTINLTTGAMTVQLNTGTGTSKATSDASGNLSLTYADGTTETVNNAYVASLVSGSSGGSSGGGSTGGSTATYNAPFIFTSAQRTITMINGSGQSIGFVAQGTPVFWSTPTSQPQALPLPAGATYASATGLNDAGQIVGWANLHGTNNGSTALYWPSATAQPVALAPPSSATSVNATAINNTGQIVGQSNTVTATGVTTTTGLYWAGSTAQPVVLSTVPTYIGPGSQILDSANALYYATPTSSPQHLPSLPGDNQGAAPMCVNASALIVGISIPGGGIAHAVTWAGGTAPAQALTAQFAQVNSQSTSANSVNSAGVIAGQFYGYSAADGNPHIVATIWKNRQVTDLNTLIPSGNASTLTAATQITDSGWILGTTTQNVNLVQTGQFILQPK